MEFIKQLKKVGIEDVPEVGGKNASLGEMIRYLAPKGVKIPGGFVVTATTYRYFLKQTGLDKFIKKTLQGLDTKNFADLAARGKFIREAIKSAELPDNLKKEIVKNYQLMEKEYGKNVDVAVRSSATAEDVPEASFAGQHETFLNIQGSENLLEAVRACFASLFKDRAISYRVDKGFSHLEVALSVGVEKMVRSDLGSSGVIFTLDTESGFPNIVLINGSWGLGEMIVQGEVIPDEFLVFKKTKAVIDKRLGAKSRKMIYSAGRGIKKTRIVPTSQKEKESFVLNDQEILKLAEWSVLVEEHYSKKYKKWMPMDLEWAKDGKTGELFIIQARPETVHSLRDFSKIKEYALQQKGKAIVKGTSVGSKIAVGKARVILDAKNLGQFKAAEILVTDMTDPDWEPIMKIASAIVTDKGGRTCFSGETKILTDKGFLEFKDVYEKMKNGEEFLIYSYDYKNKLPKWKRILSSQKNKLTAIRVSVSQTGNTQNNFIDVTKDHKFYTYKNRELIKKSLKAIIKDKEAVCLVENLPASITNSVDNKLAYLLGVLATDGSIYLCPGVNGFRRGQITFTQKESPEKQEFISTVNEYFSGIFGKQMTAREKTTVSQLRGRTISGTVTDFRCYSLSIALQINQYLQNLPLLALSFSKESAKNFLAGVIDGDGSFYNNRIQIYASKENVFQAIIISCLRLGIVPQVTTNRNIYNIQIVEKMEEILALVKKIEISAREKILGTKLFAAKQIFGDIIDTINYKGRIKPYVKGNLFIDARKIKEYLLPLADINIKKELKNVLESSLRMQRISFVKDLGEINVFNVEVEADNELDHNYVVFTNRLAPLLVSNSHAAIVSRELGIPCIVGSENATRKIKTGQTITVDTTGSEGLVFSGALKFKIVEQNIKKFPKPKTKIMMNIATPEAAFEKSFLPNDGVGLAREEFIIASDIGIHPNALINYKKLPSKIKKIIDKKTIGYKNKIQFYVDKLAYGIAKISAAFYPKPVIVRFSDFKTNEYRSLIGGELYEPLEENPMIGWRGASRYYHPNFSPAFILELKAIKKVREEMGLDNMVVMVPFCRTVEEGKKVIGMIKKFLKPLKIYVMCEIPSNVILADEFLKIFDGMSIGSNDLTQLTVGIDRDASELVRGIANENDESVKKLIAEVIKKCRAKKKYIGICGQAPSDYPEFAEFLVEQGIESMSLNPDTIIKTTLKVYEKEKRGKNNRTNL
ncbi:phosphoenolpyruvate synthase [Candidatus Wolfebacteria bacterium]|nr:phosphoenolpyruvate synthase [Candidatus Wolfebacteria bacterium]